jgi:hypothetical protein
MQLGIATFSALVVLAFAVGPPGIADSAGEPSAERSSKSRVGDLNQEAKPCCSGAAGSRSKASTEWIAYRPPLRGSPRARASGGVR